MAFRNTISTLWANTVKLHVDNNKKEKMEETVLFPDRAIFYALIGSLLQ